MPSNWRLPGAPDDVAIHTHMCYAEFDLIMDAITAMDADVISLEASRSRMEIVAELGDHSYPREIGPGIWDIHSLRIPGAAEMRRALILARGSFSDDRIWVNPDCGLKTRGYAEVEPSLRDQVAAAKSLRVDSDENDSHIQ